MAKGREQKVRFMFSVEIWSALIVDECCDMLCMPPFTMAKQRLQPLVCVVFACAWLHASATASCSPRDSQQRTGEIFAR
jgi:hypothetical protein